MKEKNKLASNLSSNITYNESQIKTAYVKEIQEKLTPIYNEIEKTEFSDSEKEQLKDLLGRDLFQKLSAFFNNISQEKNQTAFSKMLPVFQKTQEDIQREAFNDFRNDILDKLNKSLIYLYYAPFHHNSSSNDRYIVKAEDRLFASCAELGFINLVEHLIQRNEIDPTAGHYHAIHRAAENGEQAVVDTLLQDKRLESGDGLDASLIDAARNGHLDVVNLLLEDKRINQKTSNYAPMYYALKNNHPEIVKALLNQQFINHPELNSEQIKEKYCSSIGGENLTQWSAFKRAFKEVQQQHQQQGIHTAPMPLFIQYKNTGDNTLTTIQALPSATSSSTKTFCRVS